MKKDIAKNFRHVQREGHAVTRTVRDARYFLLQWTVLLLLSFFFMAGRDAVASTITLNGPFGQAHKINSSVTIKSWCEANFLETRNNMGWTLSGDTDGSPPSGYKGYDDGGWDDWMETPAILDSFAKPGGTYTVDAYCEGTSGRVTVSNSFSVSPLAGTFAAIAHGGKIVVSGTVDDGANRAGVYMDGKKVGDADNLTSDFSIDVDAAPGSHEIEVFVYYKQHHQLIGRSTVILHAAPSIIIESPHAFTQNPSITIKGRASSEVAILRSGYEWKAPGSGGSADYLAPTSSKNIALSKKLSLNEDGKHRFEFWAEAADGQAVRSREVSTILDRKEPVISILSGFKDNLIDGRAQMRVKVSDIDPRGGPGSGVASVMLEVRDATGGHGWKNMVRDAGDAYDGEYALALPFKDLPAGAFTVTVWAQDNAKNEKYAPAVQYKKAGLPIASITVPSPDQPTSAEKVTLTIKADAEWNITKIWLDAWKKNKDGSDVKLPRTDIKFTKGKKNVSVIYLYKFLDGDGEYFFRVNAEADDGQQTDAAQQAVVRVVSDKTAPTVELLAPQAGSKQKTDMEIQFKVEDKDGSGVDDVQMQLCKKEGCDAWLTAIPNDGKGVYTKTLSLADLEPGAFKVTIWAKDKAGNAESTHFDFEKALERRFGASQALALTLTLADESGTDIDATVAQQTPLTYRVMLTAKQQTLNGLSLQYRLPNGLRATGAPLLDDSNAGMQANVHLNPQWNGDTDDELLAPGTVLPPLQSIAIDIPVELKDSVDDGVSVQSTVSAGAANLADRSHSTHRIKVRERRIAGDRVRIVKSMDAEAVVQPGAHIKYLIRVSNQTFKTVRNLLIRDRAPDHTTLVAASCGDLPSSSCKTVTLSDRDVVDGGMTYAGLCTGAGPQPDPQGSHVFWCLSGDLEPLADVTVNYTVQVNGIHALGR